MNENEELLNYVFKTSEMGKFTIETLLYEIEDKDNKIKKASEDILKEYGKFLSKSEEYLNKENCEIVKLNKVDKMAASIGIKREVSKDNSDSNIASMLVQGLTMGIVEITSKIDNFKKEADKTYIKFSEDFLEFQENSVEKLKKYL